MDILFPIFSRYFTENVQINFTCKECGYTVKDIPEKFFGIKVKCHCHTIQYLPTNKPTDRLIVSKELMWKTVKTVSVGASFVLLAVFASVIFRYGGKLLEKSDSIQLILDVVLPVFGIMLAGYLSGVFGVLGNSATEALNRYCFYIALPAVFIISMSRVPLSEFINLPLITAYTGGSAATMVITLVLGRIIFNDRFEVNALRATSSIHANVGYMGIPLFMLLFGEAGLLPAIVATVIVGVGVTGTATALLELGQGQTAKKGDLNIKVLTGVLKSPLVFSAAVGLALSGFGIKMPKAAETFLETLGGSAGPCALFAIGLFMAGKPINSGTIEVFWLTVMKLVIHPLITAWLAFKVLPLDPKLASSVVILSALPTGSLVFVLAHKYRIYVHRVTSVILISTLISIVTLSLLFIVLDIA
jgi:malonate transporter